MSDTKYGKYIVTEPKPEAIEKLRERIEADGRKFGATGKTVIYVDDEHLKGAFYLESALIWSPFSNDHSHAHDFDEYICFSGTNPDDPHDLCGEVEITLGDEKHLLTKSCAIFVPKGLEHLPVVFKRVDRPILFYTTAPVPVYSLKQEK